MKGHTMTEPGKKPRKIVRILSIGVVLLVAILVIAHFAWKYSGSNQWELMREVNGVRIYSLKTPGATREQFKAVGRVKSTLNRVVALMTDTSPDACKQFVPGCIGGAIVKPWDPQNLSVTQAFRISFDGRGYPRMFSVFSPRDLVIETKFTQDPKTRSLFVECTAQSGLIPPDACCPRLTDMHNTWRFTPVDNGELELEFVANYDPGVPYWMYNRMLPAGLPRLPHRVERLYNKDKYGHTEFAWLK
jgi:hypothetical protein